MNILITGANGFLGKNLIEKLVKIDGVNIYHHSLGDSEILLEDNLKKCDFLFHFAAVHRPKDPAEFYKINGDFLGYILKTLEKYNNNCPVLLTSSIQAGPTSDYGRSKIMAEELVKEHAIKCNSKAIIYRLFNVFGKWATPNHHSVVATFCYNINRDIPIQISNRGILMSFYYVDDIINSFILQLSNEVEPDNDGIYRLQEDKIYKITLGDLADKFYYFRDCQIKNCKPELKGKIDELLLTTYLSYAE